MPDFGNINDGRPIWVEDFSGKNKAQVLFYRHEDGNWWLGSMDGSKPEWNLVSTTNFGDLQPKHRHFTGDFLGNGGADLLFFYSDDGKWWLGTLAGGTLTWNDVSDPTKDFGNINDGRLFWIADFTGKKKDQLLFVFTDGDGNNAWWLGQVTIMLTGIPVLTWVNVSNTAFGNMADGRPVWNADFTGEGRADILFYSPGDGNWWIGKIAGLVTGPIDASTFTWNLVDNTNKFGALADGRPLRIGRFEWPDKNDVLFFSPGDSAWWLGTVTFSLFDAKYHLTWRNVGTTGFGNVGDGRLIWVENFLGSGRSEVLFYYHEDGNWFLGRMDKGNLTWNPVAKTAFGDLRVAHRTWTGNFGGDSGTDLLFFYSGDQNWWLGSFSNGLLVLTLVTDVTADFGNVDDKRPIWIRDFTGGGRAQVLFYYLRDGNWWVGTVVNSQPSLSKSKLSWNNITNTGAVPEKKTWLEEFGAGIGDAFRGLLDAVEKVAGPVLNVIASIVEAIFSIPFLRWLRWLHSIATMIGSYFISFPEMFLDLLGIRLEKRLRLCVLIQRDDKGILVPRDINNNPYKDSAGNPVSPEAYVLKAVDFAAKVFKDQANVKIIPAGDSFVGIFASTSNTDTLDVCCDKCAGYKDLWTVGSAFELLMMSGNFDGNWHRMLGFGAPICAFAVRGFSDGKTGCSLGPLADYVTVDFRDRTSDPLMTTLAHEIGHACNLEHLYTDQTNLMSPTSKGDTQLGQRKKLRSWQIRDIRASRHVTYL